MERKRCEDCDAIDEELIETTWSIAADAVARRVALMIRERHGDAVLCEECARYRDAETNVDELEEATT